MAYSYKEIFAGLNDIALNADRPSAFLQAIVDFTKADAATLWSNTVSSFGPDKFFLISHCNRPDLDEQDGQLYVNTSKDDVISKTALKRKRIIRGKIGTPPFSGRWLSKTYTSQLPSLGHTRIIIAPVYDIENNPINILSLYYKTEKKEVSDEIVSGVASMIMASNEAIEKRLRQIRLERRKDRHEVLFHTRIISRKFHSISSDILRLEKGEVSYSNISRRAADISRSISVLRQSYQRASFRERVEARCSKSEYMNIDEAVSNTVSTTIAIMQKPHEVTHGNRYINRSAEILIHPDDFTMMLTNIYSNAAKYSTSGSVVRTELLEIQDGTFILNIRNDIEASIEDDLHSIWEDEVRGSKALAKGIEGEGLGLGMVSDICAVYGIAAKARYETTGRQHTKVFCVELSFPTGLVRV